MRVQQEGGGGRGEVERKKIRAAKGGRKRRKS